MTDTELCGHYRDIDACMYCDDGIDVGDFWDMVRFVNARQRERQRNQARRAKAAQSQSTPHGPDPRCSHSLTFHDPNTDARRCSFCRAEVER